MSLFGNRLKHVTCRVWESSGNAFTFPEVSADNPEAVLFHYSIDHRDAGILRKTT